MSQQGIQRGAHWIDGKFLTTGELKEAMNPASGETIGHFYDGGVAEAGLAIEAAERAFNETDWSFDAMRRAAALSHLADAFVAHQDELAALISLENGKILPEATYETGTLSQTLRFQAGVANQTFGRTLEAKPGSLMMVLREPVGVVGHIVPWNSPAVLFIRSLAPALAAGTTAVVKMPGKSALVATKMSEIISEIDEIPAGVVNIFSEMRGDGARSLVASTKVKAISFTGSTATGRSIAVTAAQSFKRVSLELGGKSPHLIFDDADVDMALPKIVKSLTQFAGQFCMTGARVLAHASRYEEVREGLAERYSRIRVGPASDPLSEMGPLIDKPNVERVDAMVEAAIAGGARVVVRGGPVTDGPLATGAFYRPTLLEVDDPRSAIVHDEVFGPVQTLQSFESEEQAIALANDSEYGLSASVWSQDVDRPLRVAQKIDAGLVSINDWVNFGTQFEIGGTKNSGLGRLGGLAAIDEFLEYKQIGHAYASDGGWR